MSNTPVRDWDDGKDYDGVAGITVKSGEKGIQVVKFQYAKGEKRIHELIHGTQLSGRRRKRKIEINHPDEYLVAVKGWSDSSNAIVGIQFETNLKKHDPMGYDIENDDTQFILQGDQGQKIVGFHGSSSTHLNSIRAHFVPNIITKKTAVRLEAVGGAGGTSWDDGANFNSVRAVYVGTTRDGIAMLKFVYGKEGQVEEVEHKHGEGIDQTLHEFKLDYPSEYLTEVEGTYGSIRLRGTDVITMLKFKTNKQRTHGPFGLIKDRNMDKPITLKKEGHKIVGFHGSTAHDVTIGDVLHNIGVYVLPLTN